MPVEIRELVVRVTTTPPTPQPQRPGSPSQTIRTMDEQALVEACVQAVLRILEERKER